MTGSLTRRRFLRGGIAGGSLVLAGCIGGTDGDSADPVPQSDVLLSVATPLQYSSPNCPCCGNFAPYLDAHTEGPLEEQIPADVTGVKTELGVPEELQTCHTSVLGDYVVEGHVPVEVMATLLDERPDIDGIGLPGMPDGSPGMPGDKTEPWTIYTFSGGTVGDVYTEY